MNFWGFSAWMDSQIPILNSFRGGSSSVWQLPENCAEWEAYLDTAHDRWGRRADKVESVANLDHVSEIRIDHRKASLLLRLLSKHWETYYLIGKSMGDAMVELVAQSE